MKIGNNKDINYRVIEDKYNQFGVGTEISANNLIKEYVAGLDKVEDKTTIQTLTEWMNKGKQYYAMAYIASVWEISIEEII